MATLTLTVLDDPVMDVEIMRYAFEALKDNQTSKRHVEIGINVLQYHWLHGH